MFFRNYTGNLPLPEPVPSDPSALAELRSLLNLSAAADWSRCLAWLAAAFRPAGPFPILVFEGPPGSGKTTAARLLRSLIDPSAAPALPLPASTRDLTRAAAQNWVLSFDHVSRISPSLTDGICRLTSASGLGAAVREAFDQRDALQSKLERPVILTTSPRASLNADIQDRALTVHFQPIIPENRLTDAEIDRRFEEARPRILGALCSALSAALRRHDKMTLSALPRFADAARWAVAAAEALGVSDKDMLAVFLPAPDPEPIATALSIVPGSKSTTPMPPPADGVMI